MKIGAHFLPEDFPVFCESVRAAERAGYARAWLVDGQMLWHDVYVYMTHALAATERIAVGSGVTNPLTRHPSVTASAHATLAQLHPGRLLMAYRTGTDLVYFREYTSERSVNRRFSETRLATSSPPRVKRNSPASAV